MSGAPHAPEPAAAGLVRALAARGETIAVAESLTGGAVTSALVEVPGVSAVLRGGIVAYATCSPHLDETRAVVSDVLATREAELLDAPSLVPQLRERPGPYLQLWPHLHGTDAMFLALLRRG